MRNERIISLRNKKKLTQKEAAKHIGISYSMLAMMESGHRIGSYSTLKKVADFYGVNIDDLFDKNFFNHYSRETREKEVG